MTVSEAFKTALLALWSFKLRSFLTILGMVIGVFAVITLVSVGQGAKRYVLGEFQSLGANIIIIQPGKSDNKSKFGAPIGISKKKMTIDDVLALQKKTYHLEAISGLVMGTALIKQEDLSANINIFGSNDQFFQILSLQVQLGRHFNSEEDASGRRVVVLGSKITEKLFGNDNAIGKSVKINQVEFKVIGVLKSAGDKLGLNIDEFGFIPTISAMRIFNTDSLFGIRAKSSSRVSIDTAVSEIYDILKERRNGEEDFTIVTQVAIMDSLDGILGMLSYVLGAIASISMLVGGIGIMNITLVSVSERIQEIGVRRAVGASAFDISMQFFIESIALSIISGLIGIFASIILTYGICILYPSFDMSPPSWIYLPAFSLAVIIGGLFGVWPARKAANIEILDALRHE